jgi:hypothetical protein
MRAREAAGRAEHPLHPHWSYNIGMDTWLKEA